MSFRPLFFGHFGHAWVISNSSLGRHFGPNYIYVQINKYIFMFVLKYIRWYIPLRIHLTLSFSLYTALGHVWPWWQDLLWVWHIYISYLKNQQKDINTKPPHLLQTDLRDRHTKPCPYPTLGYYILDLNPSTVSAETASVVSPFQVKR